MDKKHSVNIKMQFEMIEYKYLIVLKWNSIGLLLDCKCLFSDQCTLCLSYIPVNTPWSVRCVLNQVMKYHSSLFLFVWISHLQLSKQSSNLDVFADFFSFCYLVPFCFRSRIQSLRREILSIQNRLNCTALFSLPIFSSLFHVMVWL